MEQIGCGTPFDRGELCRACSLRTRFEGGAARCSRMVAESPAMRSLLVRAAALARASAPVVLQGETGTGKEVLARVLHATSPRSGKPFVAVNCAALPGDLLESELFGHSRGAFTGAVSDKAGLFEEAEGGTLLLDEVAELPLPLQAKLLRVLQDGEVRRVGSNRPHRADVRVFAATHRELRGQVERGAFREDLFYRLNVFALTLPPLRERKEDILPIALQLLELEKSKARGFSRDAERALLAYGWPGNIRELSNAVRHGAALAQSAEVRADDLPDEVRRPRSARPSMRPLAEVEREHVLAVLDSCGGNQAEAARVLGLARNTLWRRLRAYGAESRRA
ncbi:MAG: sigma-54 interaction domain-containing protein [Deltaproteobacteria bacterium]